jgi:hypothetical protein
MAVPSRFDELRYRTDKQLLRVVNSVLDSGMLEARQALRCGDNRVGARHHFLLAKRRYVDAAYLILLADARLEKQAVCARLEHLRDTLDEMSGPGSPWTAPADDLAALTRAVSADAELCYSVSSAAGD